MFLKKLFGHEGREQRVVEGMERHIGLLCEGCSAFFTALEHSDAKCMKSVKDLEREADTIRREIVSLIYEGAFLPYLRPELSKFVEIVDQVFDRLEDAAVCYLGVSFPEALRRESSRIALLNQKMSEMLHITFQAMIAGEDLREKKLAIRIYEKRIDDMKFGLIQDARRVRIDDFWEGRILADFLSHLCAVSDTIEDASDCLGIIAAITK
ncbi:MAG: TIGR00153 family protein [Desulfobacteraceae bacterium]